MCTILAYAECCSNAMKVYVKDRIFLDVFRSLMKGSLPLHKIVSLETDCVCISMYLEWFQLTSLSFLSLFFCSTGA
jgi:hypothetical protein